jgi:hypothetical protein
MLHKKRTGKAFHITKDIVEKEAMYEEVDERYQEKRIKMLQAQNMQIEEEFHQHLLKAFAKRASYSNASSIASRRASAMTPIHSTDHSRKMSLDLSNLRDNSLQSQMISPMPNDYVLSPSASYDQSQYMCESPYPAMMPTTATTPAQIPAYVQPWSNYPKPTWMQQMPTPDQTPTDAHAVQMWQQQMMHQAPEPVQMHHFRDRLASAPEVMHQTHGQSLGHSRGHSQPSSSFNNLHLLTQSHVPKVEALSAESASDFPMPHTPVSPTAVPKMETDVMAKVEGDAMVSGELDPDYTDFSQFALNLGNVSERDQFGFEDFVAVDEFTSVSS